MQASSLARRVTTSQRPGAGNSQWIGRRHLQKPRWFFNVFFQMFPGKFWEQLAQSMASHAASAIVHSFSFCWPTMTHSHSGSRAQPTRSKRAAGRLCQVLPAEQGFPGSIKVAYGVLIENFTGTAWPVIPFWILNNTVLDC